VNSQELGVSAVKKNASGYNEGLEAISKRLQEGLARGDVSWQQGGLGRTTHGGVLKWGHPNSWMVFLFSGNS